MSKTPPNRRGITFEVGAQLEARDNLKNWYAANIEKIDYDDEKVLIHYRQWSHRYDEWFDWASPYLRPVDRQRIQLRREGLQEDCPLPGFHVNDKVLASWTDCRFYPAKVLAVNKDASYTVKFFDGVIQTVKGIHVKPFIRERNRTKSRSSETSGEKHPVKKLQNGRERTPQESSSSKRVQRSTSDPKGGSGTEEEEDDEEEGDSDAWQHAKHEEESGAKVDAPSHGMKEEEKEKEDKKRVMEKKMIQTTERKDDDEEESARVKEEDELVQRRARERERAMEAVAQHNYSAARVQDAPERVERGDRNASDQAERGDRNSPEQAERGDRNASHRVEKGDRNASDQAERGDRNSPEQAERGDRNSPEQAERGDRNSPEQAERGDRNSPEQAERGDRNAANQAEGGDRNASDRVEKGDRNTSDQAEAGNRNSPEQAETGDKNASDRVERGDGNASDRAERGDRNSTDRAERGDGNTSDRAEAGDRNSPEQAETGDKNASDRAERGDGNSTDRAERGDGNSPDRAERGDGNSTDRAERGDGNSTDQAERGDGNASDRAERGDRNSTDQAERGDRNASDRAERGDRNSTDRAETGDRNGLNTEEESGPNEREDGNLAVDLAERVKKEVNRETELSVAGGVQAELKEEVEVTGHALPQGRRPRGRGAGGGSCSVLELRKRRVSVEPSSPCKRSRTDAPSDKSLPDETKPSSELSNQKLAEAVPESVLAPSAKLPSATAEQRAQGQSDVGKPAVATPPAAAVKAVRKQGFHNPNRFSREPLYRVIKNQPPPALSINLDHNPFKCSAPGCPKSFRKAKLLHYHLKYYHGEERPAEGQLSPSRSIQNRAAEKQVAATPRESPKRRRTISTSLHSALPSPPSPRADGKPSSQLGEKRRASAPPAVGTQNQQPRPLLTEKSRENQLDRNGHKDKERSPVDIARVKERDRLKEKKVRDFLRIKLKKKKKKKKSKSEYTGSEENIDISIFQLQSKLNMPLKLPLSHKHPAEAYGGRPGLRQAERPRADDEESVTDWSTDSCGWSEDEVGAELDITSPPLTYSAVTLETRGSEIVRCVCEVEEENDFMIQCEECLCWQHGTCMGLLEDNVPDRYACYICRDPPGQRQSLRYWYDRDWLSSGHMFGLSFVEENYSQQNAQKMAATHQLLGDVQRVVEVLSGLQLKMSVLQSQTHPDLKLWCQPWKRADWPRRRCGSGAAPSPMPADKERSRGTEPGSAASSSSSSSSSSPPYTSFQGSYISSEHCYQKPWTYYPAVEQRLVVETRGGSELEERLLEYEQRYGGELHPRRPAPPPAQPPNHAKEADCGRLSRAGRGVEVKVEDVAMVMGGGEQQQQWRMNLLDHIEAMQDEVTHRMDAIERELDVLESWLDYTGELEPPEPLARLPQLKQRIKQLLAELGTVQRLALACSA